jgi:uncharacterized protein YjiK
MKTFFLLLSFIGILLSCRHQGPGPAVPGAPPPPDLIAVYPTSIAEPSGLAFHHRHNTLLTVSDRNGTVYELDFTGHILRSFRLEGVDLEGIALSATCDTMYVVDEADESVSQYISDSVKLSSFTVPIATEANHSLEGVTVAGNNHLFVINEKAPRMLLEFDGPREVFRKELDYTADLSDIFYDPAGDCLWIVSDESRKVVKLTRAGVRLAEYGIPFYKGEGIAVVNDRIFIINDADGKLYVFKKP